MNILGFLSTRNSALSNGKQVVVASVVAEEDDECFVFDMVASLVKDDENLILVATEEDEQTEIERLDEDEIDAASQRARNLEMKRKMKRYKKRPSKHSRLLGYYITKRDQKGVGSGRGKRYKAVMYVLKGGKVRVRSQTLSSIRDVPGFTPKRGAKPLPPNQVRGKKSTKAKLDKMIAAIKTRAGGGGRASSGRSSGRPPRREMKPARAPNRMPPSQRGAARTGA